MSNVIIQRKIQTFLIRILDYYKECSLDEILDSYDLDEYITPSEIQKVIDRAVKAGNLQVRRDDKKNKTYYTIVKPFKNALNNNTTTIVISKPRLKQLRLDVPKLRNDFIDTKECYKKIFQATRTILRICSPFFEYNFFEEFPEFVKYLQDLLREDVEIKVLTRDSKQVNSQLKKLNILVKNEKKLHNLKISRYHLFGERGTVFSSTHAKMLIADNSLAYIGSAEVRKNSILANFEVGCLITDESVFGLCEIFDLMFNMGIKKDEIT